MGAFIQIDNPRLTEMLVGNPTTAITVHENLVKPLSAMLNAAQSHGFDLVFASAHRSFESQVKIWNDKVLGIRPIRNSQGQIVDVQQLNETEIVFMILRWSALPGTSRHQWGTDLDFFDRANLPNDYRLQLVPQEYERGGPFYKAKCWLNENAESFGFYFPYQKDRGGVMPEPWHISYRPLANEILNNFNFEFFRAQLERSDFLLSKIALDHAQEIYDRFVMNVD